MDTIYDRKPRDVAEEIRAGRADRAHERTAKQRSRDAYYAANFPLSPLASKSKVKK